jgi:hypothetical protein
VPHASFPRPAFFGTFAVFPLLCFSMNTLSLFGLFSRSAWSLMTPSWWNLTSSFAHEVSFANKEATSFEDVKGNIDTR